MSRLFGSFKKFCTCTKIRKGYIYGIFPYFIILNTGIALDELKQYDKKCKIYDMKRTEGGALNAMENGVLNNCYTNVIIACCWPMYITFIVLLKSIFYYHDTFVREDKMLEKDSQEQESPSDIYMD